VGEKTHFCTVVSLLATAVYRQGRYEEAEELTHECERAARQNDVHTQILWRATRAKAIARKGDLGAAERLAREAVAFAGESDFLNGHGDALVAQAEVLRLAGRPAEAALAVEHAVAFYEQKGNVVSATRARALLAELRDAAPSAAEAELL
jgi:ATP/maltotriose-dependent transcriptional regulator MalT